MSGKKRAKKEAAARHNLAYHNEVLRLSGLTDEERRAELISAGIKSAMAVLKPQMNELIGIR